MWSRKGIRNNRKPTEIKMMVAGKSVEVPVSRRSQVKNDREIAEDLPRSRWWWWSELWRLREAIR
jgi:hypothetical protein